MVAWLKALLFAGGGLVAAGGTAYVTGMLDPWLARTPPVVAALPDTQAPATPPAAVDPAPPAADPETTDKQSRLAPPTFDLLRVEPDGSMLVAGNAVAGSQVEVVTGDTVLDRSEAGAAGDFVVVLDEPLPPGDYQITLRATRGEETVISGETAIVSIPDEAGGQVLAMVEQPGEPSRIIAAPQAPAADDPEPQDAGEDVAAAPEPEAPETVAVEPEAPEAVAPDGDVAAAPEADAQADAPDTAETVPEAPAGEAPEVAAAPETTDEPAAPAEADAAPEAAVAPAQDEPSEPTEPDVAAAPGAGEGTPEADAPAAPDVVTGPAEAEPEVDVAAAPEPQAPEVAPQPAVTHQVVVEAVEIDGDTVFVAGFATPGRTVRVYANALYLGDARASEAGRFLIETRRDLPVGEYVIRADLLERDGTVLARAAVPFEREPGENIAAVAPQGAPPQAGGGEDGIAEAPAPQEAVTPAEPAETVAAAPEAGPAKTPAPDQPGEPAVAEAMDQPDEPEVAGSPAPAAEAPAAPEPPAPAGEDKAPVVAGEPQAPSEPAVAAEAPGDAAEPEEDEVIAAAPPADDPELTGPKLQRVDGAVIIRRGDTLWRISRRVYGRGVRYSTIYLANQDQISDPDRIWPGQVFAVPEETPEGDTADMQAIGEQAVPPDTESKIIR